METSKRNSLRNYLYLKLAKTSCFSFYLLSFFFSKIRKQEGSGGGRNGTGGKEEVAGK
jgi:hypothetical protein